MYKEVDYKSIVSDLNELITEAHWNYGWTFSLTDAQSYLAIDFNDVRLWDTENYSSGDEDWTTETLLQHCIMEFKKYRELLNTIKIK